jgi:hypothetical protein
MPSATLATAATLSLATGVAYALVGWRFAARARGAGGAPLAFFSLFWFAVAYYGVTDGLWSLAVPMLDPPVAVGITILYTKTLVGCVGFFGLVYYLTYVYTGDRRLLVPLAAFYAAVYVLVLYAYVHADPVGQVVQPWRSGLVYANPGTFLDTLSVLALFAPPLLAAIAYARLYAKTADPTRRRRILTVSAAFATFFGGLLFGWLGGSVWYWWPLAEKVLALGAIGAVYLVVQGD